MKESSGGNGGITRRTFLKGTTGAIIGLSALKSFNVKAQNSVKLGVIWPPKDNPAGLQLYKGADYAASLVNSQSPLKYPELIPAWEGIPSLGNAKLELIYADHEFDPERGAQLVGEMKPKGVACIIGSLGSNVTLKVSEAAAEAGLPMLTCGSIISPLTKRGYDSFYRICADNVQGAKALFAALSNFMDQLSEEEQRDVPTNYIYMVKEYPGLEDDLKLIKGFAEEGVEGEFEGRFKLTPLVFEEGSTNADVRDKIFSMNLGKDDAIIPVLFSGSVLFLIRELAEKIPVPEERPGLLFVDPYLTTLQGVIQGLSLEEMKGWRWTFSNIQFFSGVFEADANFASDFIGLFRDSFTENVGRPNPLNALAFTGVHTWAAILNMAESTKKADIVKAADSVALRDIMITNWNGIKFGETKFGDKGANVDVIPGTAHLDERGNLEIVELPGGFTPSNAYANLNIVTNPGCLINCVTIGVTANISQQVTEISTTIDDHSGYAWDSYNTTTTSTTSGGGGGGGGLLDALNPLNWF